jgi:hypothetical protein
VPQLADGGSGREFDRDAAGLDAEGFNIEDLHGVAGRTDLEGQPAFGLQADLGSHLLQGNVELADLQGVRLLGRGQPILHLQDGFPPGVRIAAAIGGHEGARLHLGNVVAGLGLPPGLGDHQPSRAMKPQDVEPGAQRGVAAEAGGERQSGRVHHDPFHLNIS